MKHKYSIGKDTTVTKSYGIDITEYTWPAKEAMLLDYPEKEVKVYKSKSGWIVQANGNSFGREKHRFGWYGFDTPEEAVENYVTNYVLKDKQERKGRPCSSKTTKKR